MLLLTHLRDFGCKFLPLWCLELHVDAPSIIIREGEDVLLQVPNTLSGNACKWRQMQQPLVFQAEYSWIQSNLKH